MEPTLTRNEVREIRHFHLFCGLGGGAKGFNQARPRVGNLIGRFRCLGGIDVSAAAIRDFERLSGVRGTVMDLFDRAQFEAFHGAPPPSSWREAGPMDLRMAAGGEYPHIVFLSAQCKGFSGLLAEGKSKTDKYQALNRLTLRGVWLMLEAFAAEPPGLIVFENVPRIASRGRHLLDQIGALLRQYGYAVAETTHDCGEIGGLAQSRKRFLLVARHVETVPPFLYEPDKKPLQAVGTVLARMPLPGDPAGGPMHRIPTLQWKTWVRLAFVLAGSDWRSLNRLTVAEGVLRDFGIAPAFRSSLGVIRWSEVTGVIAGESLPLNGAFSVADPHCPGTLHNNAFRVVRYTEHAQAVTGGGGAVGGCVADPRRDGPAFGKYAVTPWAHSAGTVISGSTTGQGAYVVADPRSGMEAERVAFLTGGHYGGVPWDRSAGAVSAAACHDNGRWSVADPRVTCSVSFNRNSPSESFVMPGDTDHLVAVILAEDGTWHRPFTTLELAALQSLVDPEEVIALDGLSDSAWRERIGNAVPPGAAQAIAEVMGTTLLLAWAGETFSLSSMPIWVRPIAVALSVKSVP